MGDSDWGVCAHCGVYAPLKAPDSMTSYDWDGQGRDPNFPGRMCGTCCEDYVDYWAAARKDLGHG